VAGVGGWQGGAQMNWLTRRTLLTLHVLLDRDLLLDQMNWLTRRTLLTGADAGDESFLRGGHSGWNRRRRRAS
jgi:hypothetical protein